MIKISNAIGSSFDISYQAQVENPDWKLVHGICFDQPHAWLSKDGEVYDVVFKCQVPQDLYEAYFAVAHFRYTREEAAKHALAAKYIGPWVEMEKESILQVFERLRNIYDLFINMTDTMLQSLQVQDDRFTEDVRKWYKDSLIEFFRLFRGFNELQNRMKNPGNKEFLSTTRRNWLHPYNNSEIEGLDRSNSPNRKENHLNLIFFKKIIGRCIHCNQPAVQGYVRCEKHLEASRKNSVTLRKKRKAEGRCIRCGFSLVDKGKPYTTCVSCADKKHNHYLVKQKMTSSAEYVGKLRPVPDRTCEKKSLNVKAA
jgi:hypothetical protein